MKPAPFDYMRAQSLADAASAKSEYGADARILAGGQSLMAMLNMRLAEPQILIDISDLEEARYIKDAGAAIEIGCATRQVELERWPSLAADLPLFAKAVPWIGHVQTRSRGTVCGSIAHGDPSSELPLCLALCEGEIVLAHKKRARRVKARDFFLGVLETACGADEIISAISIPKTSAQAGIAFHEVAMRHGDFAIIAVGAIATASALTIGIGGTSSRPEIRTWPVLEENQYDDALNELAWALDCQDDLHASATYRRQLIRKIGRKTIKEAMNCRS